MRNIGLALATALVAAVFVGGSARAADDTYVSAAGADADDCAVAAPCASLRYALRRTTPGGTIVILTSGRYGAIDITKSVHIIAKGVQAVLEGLASCKAVVCIDAGPNDFVSIDGLTIEVSLPYKPESIGILFNTGAALQIENCVIGSYSSLGLAFYPQSSAHLSVFHSTITGAGEGIEMMALGGASYALFDGVNVHEGNEGLVLQAAGSGSMQAMIRSSLVANQNGRGIDLHAGTGGVPVAVMLDRSVVADSGQVGVQVDAGGSAIIRIGDTTISGTPSPFNSNGGTIASYGNNRFIAGLDGVPAPTTIPLK